MRKQNKAAYHLIDEESHGYSIHEESGWDTDHRGHGEAYPAVGGGIRPVKSVNTKYRTFRRRSITEETEGKLTFETSFRIVSGDGFYLGFWGENDGLCEAFVLRQRNGCMYTGIQSLFATDNDWHYIKIVLDIDNAKGTVHLDGKCVGTFDFTGNAKSISRVEYGYEACDIGEAIVHMDFKLYKNYFFNDQLVAHFEGSLPEEYVIETDGKAKAVRRKYHETSKYAIYDLSAKQKSCSTITRKFDKSTGKVGYEMKYFSNDEAARFSISFVSGKTDAFTVYDEKLQIKHNDKILRKYSKNVWQTLRIEADADAKTVLVRLNGKIAANLDFDTNADYVDAVKLTFETQNQASLLFTDLKCFPIPPLADDYVPEPVIPKKKGDYYVGMNVCSIWREGTMYGWECITPFKENKPYLGYYDEGNSETADWEIKWMAEHGLDFELFCWYGGERNKPMVKTWLSNHIYDGYMLAKYSDKVKFALLWEASTACPNTFEDFKNYFVPLFIDYFFSDERYMQIDGAAIMSIYAPDRLAQQFGGAEIAKCAFDYLREEVKKLGYRDLVIMCCGESKPFYKECGMDAVHAYNLGPKGYDLQYTKDYNLANTNEGSVFAVPTVSMGYNWLAWTGERRPVLDPDDMVEALEWCKETIVDKYEDKTSWKSKLLMLSTWNEYGEGTYMCPSDVHCFGYLDALRTVFCEDAPHTDVVPTQDQLDRICILYPQGRATIAPHDTLPKDNTDYGLIRRYEFKTEEDISKWEMFGPMTCELKDGKLVGHSNGQNPYMILHDDEFFPISTEKIGRIVAYIRTSKPVNSMDIIQHSYKFGADEWFDKQPYAFSNPESIVPLTIEPAKIKGYPWHQTLYGFRFDPVWGEGDFELEAIEFYAQKPHYTFKVDGKIIDLCQNVYIDDGTAYIPFDTKSELKKLPAMYYEWNESKQMLSVFGEKTGVFKKNCDIAVIDGKNIKLKKSLEFADGIPHIQGDILCDILGKQLEIDKFNISFN